MLIHQEAKGHRVARKRWYLEERSFSLKELREVADVLGYSYSYLSHVFREEMGMSLQSYYSRIKVRKAMEAVRKTDATVTRVAESAALPIDPFVQQSV